MNRNKAARIIQRKWRAGVADPLRDLRYIMVVNKNNTNRYPKPTQKAIANYIREHGISLTQHPYMSNKYMFSSINRRGRNISNFHKFLKERLPKRLLPKIVRFNWNRFEMLEKKLKVITNVFFPVRKIIKILKRHPSLRYAARIMENLNAYADKYSNYIKNENMHINDIKNLVARNIGMCHLNTTLRNNPSVNKVTYLLYYRNQMKLACEQIVKNKMPEKEFVTKFKAILGNRPCIENLIDSLSQVAFGEVQWKGVNRVINLHKKNNLNALRNDIIAKYMKSHFNSIRQSGNKSNYTKNRLWNSIKNRPLYILTRNGPVYIPVKNVPNTRAISKEAHNMYAQYLE